MNALNKSNITKRNLPSYKFIPSQNQEFYAINDGNVEYIIYNDEQGDINKNLNQKSNYTHLNNIKLIKTNNCKENRKHHYTGNKIYEEYYSNEVLNTQPNSCKKIVKYLSPEPENRKQEKIRYFNQDDYLYQKANNNYNKLNKNLNINLNTNNNIFTGNKNIKNINDFSYNNQNNNNYYIKNKPRIKNGKQYFYENELNIINNKEENKRSFSNDYKYMKDQIPKRNTKTKLFLFKINRDNKNGEYNLIKSKSFDKKNLKMQNSQNIQIVNKDKLYQILIPIPKNEIDYNCKFLIPKDNDRHKYNKINNEKQEQNIITNKTEKKINQNEKYIKKQINKKLNNKLKNEQIKIDIKSNSKDFSIDNFSLNIEESGRKFKGELSIVNTDLNNYKGKTKNWNDIIKPRNEPFFTIEKIKPKEKILYEQNNENIYYKGNQKINLDLKNTHNLKKLNIVKQKNVFFTINGIAKSWNDLIKINKGIDVILKAKNNKNNKNKNNKENMSKFYEINFINEKIVFDSSEPEEELNSFYSNNNIDINNNNKNESYRYSYRESLTNKEQYKNEKIENENDEMTEGTSKSEIFQSFSPKSTLSKKYREQIICGNPKLNENINKEIYVEENEAIINQSNNLNNSEKKKSHLEYVFKNNFSKINKSCNEFEKSKTFIKQMKFDVIKPIVKIETEYNVKFPEQDKLNQFQRESGNSSLNENLNSLKENISNINNFNSFNIKHNNNIIKQGVPEGN